MKDGKEARDAAFKAEWYGKPIDDAWHAANRARALANAEEYAEGRRLAEAAPPCVDGEHEVTRCSTRDAVECRRCPWTMTGEEHAARATKETP